MQGTKTTPPARLSLLSGLLFWVGGSCTHNPAYYADPLPPPAAKLSVVPAPQQTGPDAATLYHQAWQAAVVAVAAAQTARWENGRFYQATQATLAARRANALCALDQAAVATTRASISACTLVAVPDPRPYDTHLHFPIGRDWAYTCTQHATAEKPCQEGASIGLSENLARPCARWQLWPWGEVALNLRVAHALGLAAGQLACAYEGQTGVDAWNLLAAEQRTLRQGGAGAAAISHRHAVLTSDSAATLKLLDLTLHTKLDLLVATHPEHVQRLDSPAWVGAWAAILDLVYTQEKFVDPSYAPAMWAAVRNSDPAKLRYEIAQRSALGAGTTPGVKARRQAAGTLVADSGRG